jgi:proteasome lid subunit RPN8/RPN11
MVVSIGLEVLKAIWAHIERQPEYEVCGILLGTLGTSLLIDEPIEGGNLLVSPSEYLIDAATLLAADTRAQQTGRSIAGFYHSHPRHLPLPSDRDRHLAWPNHLYLIVMVKDLRATGTCGWFFDRAGHTSPALIQIQRNK